MSGLQLDQIFVALLKTLFLGIELGIRIQLVVLFIYDQAIGS